MIIKSSGNVCWKWARWSPYEWYCCPTTWSEKGSMNVADLAIGIQLAGDRKAATIEFVVDGQPAKPVPVDLDQLTKLIAVLGDLRARMLEGRPRLKLEGKEVRTVTCPNWYIQVAQIDGSLLAFDHTAFGPVGFAIPKAEVAEMVRILNGHLAMPTPPLEKKN
jgi:hypothetical protein